jgi:hypothetical protein
MKYHYSSVVKTKLPKSVPVLEGGDSKKVAEKIWIKN